MIVPLSTCSLIEGKGNLSRLPCIEHKETELPVTMSFSFGKQLLLHVLTASVP